MKDNMDFFERMKQIGADKLQVCDGTEKRLLAELNLLRVAFLAVARADTAYQPFVYKNLHNENKLVSPLFLHCCAVATTIKAIYGGDIVSGRINGVSHYWNRLPDGKEIDLTSCQFGGDGINPLKKGRRVTARKLTNPQFLLFAERVKNYLTKPLF